MRDLLFKNLTSGDKRRRAISSSEIADSQGVRSIIRRHFIYVVKEINQGDGCNNKPLPYLYVLKERDTTKQTEKFFCRLKGSMYALNQGKVLLILFMHSLKITLISMPQDLLKHSQGEK